MTATATSRKQGLRAVVRAVLPRAFLRHRAVAAFADEANRHGEAELQWLGALVKKGELALDVGANAGVYTWVLHRAGAQVLAVEPNPNLADRLRGFNFSGVSVLNSALSDHAGKANLRMANGNTGLATLEPLPDIDGPSFEVPLTTLDSLGLDRVAFIKIDVEGHEEKVLAGAAATIGRDKPILLIEIEDRHNEGGLARVVELLANHTAWFLVDGTWLPVEQFDAVTHQPLSELKRYEEGVARRDCRYFNNFLFLPHGTPVPAQGEAVHG